MSVGEPVFGWDVGGAHVKVSKVSASGAVLDIAQWACPLWQGLGRLENAIVSRLWFEPLWRSSRSMRLTGNNGLPAVLACIEGVHSCVMSYPASRRRLRG